MEQLIGVNKWEDEFDLMDKDNDGKIRFEDFIRYFCVFIMELKFILIRWAFKKTVALEVEKLNQLDSVEKCEDEKNNLSD